jgi:hypothetical protein
MCVHHRHPSFPAAAQSQATWRLLPGVPRGLAQQIWALLGVRVFCGCVSNDCLCFQGVSFGRDAGSEFEDAATRVGYQRHGRTLCDGRWPLSRLGWGDIFDFIIAPSSVEL